jgi:hypothetical protein
MVLQHARGECAQTLKYDRRTQVGSYIVGDRADSRSVRPEPSNHEHGDNPQAPPQSEEEVTTDLRVRTMTLRNTADIGT